MTKVVSVLELGCDVAFAMIENEIPRLWIGRIDVMRRRNRAPMNDPILLDDAKIDGILLNCTWLEKQADGR